MIYLSHFEFPDIEWEYSFVMSQKRTCYDTFYPFYVLSKNRLSMLDFEPVTVLYGGNGSGKTTALNVIAEKLELPRDTLYNRSNFLVIIQRNVSMRLKLQYLRTAVLSQATMCLILCSA